MRPWVKYLVENSPDPCTGSLGDLFYNLPLHVDEQHGGHSVGSMTELLAHAPLTDEAPASAGDLVALQTVEAGEIVHEVVLARTDAGSESAHGSLRRYLMRMGGGATWGAAR